MRKNFGRRSGVIVDWCGRHGTWFDPDELERVAAFVAAGGLVEPAAAAEPGKGDEVRIVLKESAWQEASPWAVVLEKLFEAWR